MAESPVYFENKQTGAGSISLRAAWIGSTEIGLQEGKFSLDSILENKEKDESKDEQTIQANYSEQPLLSSRGNHVRMGRHQKMGEGG